MLYPIELGVRRVVWRDFSVGSAFRKAVLLGLVSSLAGSRYLPRFAG